VLDPVDGGRRGDLVRARAVGDVVNDSERERLIEAYRVVLELEPRHDFQAAAMQRMRELISGRAPQQIERMETERGLRVS
jgi:hypothetical protein